jgi:hypothetical protein
VATETAALLLATVATLLATKAALRLEATARLVPSLGLEAAAGLVPSLRLETTLVTGRRLTAVLLRRRLATVLLGGRLTAVAALLTAEAALLAAKATLVAAKAALLTTKAALLATEAAAAGATAAAERLERRGVLVALVVVALTALVLVLAEARLQSQRHMSYRTHDLDVVLRNDLLEATLGEELVVDVASRDRVVTNALVAALTDGLRGETLEARLLVLALLLPPLAHVVKHNALDLGAVREVGVEEALQDVLDGLAGVNVRVAPGLGDALSRELDD